MDREGLLPTHDGVRPWLTWHVPLPTPTFLPAPTLLELPGPPYSFWLSSKQTLQGPVHLVTQISRFASHSKPAAAQMLLMRQALSETCLKSFLSHPPQPLPAPPLPYDVLTSQAPPFLCLAAPPTPDSPPPFSGVKRQLLLPSKNKGEALCQVVGRASQPDTGLLALKVRVMIVRAPTQVMLIMSQTLFYVFGLY